MIFNTECNDLQFYNGSSWIPVSNSNFLLTPGVITGNTAPCSNQSGGTYSIAPVSGATGYSWSVPPGVTVTNGQGTPSILVSFGNTGGVVCVQAHNNCYKSNVSCLDVNLLPESPVSISISASANPVCFGSSVTFTATIINGGTTPAYQWIVNGLNIIGATNNTYSTIPVANDAVKCLLTSNLICSSGNPATSNTISMTVIQPPGAADPISGNSTYCSNMVYIFETSYFITPIAGATYYNWTVPYGTVIISGAGTSSLVTNSPPGMGIFSVYGTNQCGSGAASYLQVSMYPSPNPTLSGPWTVCQGSDGNTYATQAGMTDYQWFVNWGGIKTAGGTSTDNTVTVKWNTTGSKSVQVSYKNTYGCGGSSNPLPNVTVVNAGLIAPAAGIHVPSQTQIEWHWAVVEGATGYKWNTTNDYGTATDIGLVITKTETGMTCNTPYTRYVWAYHSCGNSIPVTLTQPTTACSFTCGASFTDSRDNQVYTTVQIGSQCWFKENLNIGIRINAALEQTNNSMTEKYCYNDLESNCSTYGGLYQWNEMMQYINTAGAQGICPSGWHIPTDGEWCTVTQFLDPTVNCIDYGSTGTNAGGKMKSTGTIQAGTGKWYTPNTGATNESGFTAFPAGHRNSTGTLINIGSYGYWWSSTEYNSNEALYHYLSYSSNSVFRIYSSRSNGLSARCLKD